MPAIAKHPTESDRPDLVRLKTEICTRVRRQQPQPSGRSIRLGRLLRQVRRRKLHELDGYKSFPRWAWKECGIRRTQTNKYIKIGRALPPAQVRGTTLSIDVLYEIALAGPWLRPGLIA